jgi:hypothetical protein
MLGMAIPVFLTPRRDLDLNALPPTTRVQIHFGRADLEASWTITRSDTGESIFTFDLPAELFERYAENGVLTRRAALNLKEDVFGQFTAIYSPQMQLGYSTSFWTKSGLRRLGETLAAAPSRRASPLSWSKTAFSSSQPGGSARHAEPAD